MSGAILRSGYRPLYVETYGGDRRGYVRVRPLPEQWASSTLNVSCSKAMRAESTIGSVFRIQAIIKELLGVSVVYTHHDWPYEKVDRNEALAAIRRGC